MAEALHRAIEDALRDSPGYADKAIRTGTFFEATRPLEADGSLLYTSVYTLFRALPERLMEGSALNISTSDTDSGVELVWEGRERAEPGAAPETSQLRTLLRRGPHGDLVEIALLALEQFCNMRMGYVETKRERVEASTSFDRPAYVIRRVHAHIPGRRNGQQAGMLRPAAEPETRHGGAGVDGGHLRGATRHLPRMHA